MLHNLPIDQIKARPDARAVSADNIAALADSIADVGLINPIRVRAIVGGWEVIAGNHRLAACASLGLVEIAADVVEAGDDDAELAMVDENLIRQDFSPAERSRYMAIRKELYLRKHPDGRSRNSQPLGNPPADRFTLHVAKVTGQSEGTIQKQVYRGENVLPNVLNMVLGTPLDTDTYLNTIARLPPGDQVYAVERDLAFERNKDRQATRKVNSAASAKREAATEAANIILEYVHPDDLSALRSALRRAGADNIAKAMK